MMGRICPPVYDRVKVFENLGATAVVPVPPVDTSLLSLRRGLKILFFCICFNCEHYIYTKYFQKYLVKSQVRRNKNATLKKILPHCSGQLSFAPMPSFMDSGPAETGFQGKDRNAPLPPIPLCFEIILFEDISRKTNWNGRSKAGMSESRAPPDQLILFQPGGAYSGLAYYAHQAPTGTTPDF